MRATVLTLISIVLGLAGLHALAAESPKAGGRDRRPQQRDTLVSPEAGKDGTVTFRLRAPQANAVSVTGEFGPAAPMTKGADGVWSAKIGPLKPNIYDYHFVIDGVTVADPANPDTKTQTTSIALVPGDPPRPWEMQEVPHGAVAMHWYRSKASGTTRRVLVYTPPGYAKGDQQYPVLYLLHGSGDNEMIWCSSGKANLVADNLIAAGKAAPMLIVMPNGHVPMKPADAASPERGNINRALFEKDLLEDVVPLVEASYRVARDPAHRAIAGLSMGGAQAGMVGLNHPELFGWVGVWSMGGREPETTYARMLGKMDEVKKNLKLLWIGCGRQDTLIGIDNAEGLSKWMADHGVKNEFHPSEGGHQWTVWRQYLSEFVPLLFR